MACAFPLPSVNSANKANYANKNTCNLLWFFLSWVIAEGFAHTAFKKEKHTSCWFSKISSKKTRVIWLFASKNKQTWIHTLNRTAKVVKRKAKPGYVGLIGYSYSEKDDKFLVHLPLIIKKDWEETFCSIWATVKRREEKEWGRKGTIYADWQW